MRTTEPEFNRAAVRSQYKGRIQHDPHGRGNLFARIMTDQVLFDYRIIDREQADKDCDLWVYSDLAKDISS